MVEASHSPRSLRAAQSLLGLLPAAPAPSPLNPATAERKRVVVSAVRVPMPESWAELPGQGGYVQGLAPTPAPLRPIQRATVVAPASQQFQFPEPLRPVSAYNAPPQQQGASLHVKQGWTPDEDVTIMELVEQLGQKWSTISAALPGRTDDAVRNRFLRLQRKRKHDGGEDDKAGDMWTPIEDQLIMEAAGKFGLKWHAIASAVPGRSANAVRNRFLRTWTSDNRCRATGTAA